MNDFEYYRPQTIDEALTLYKRAGAAAKLLAGGTELVNEMRIGKTRPAHVIDLKSIQDMDFLDLNAEGLRIGALYRVRDAEISEQLHQSPYRVLSDAAGTLGSPQVRNKATIAGNVCRCSPSADLIPPLVALNASARIKTEQTERMVRVEEMLLGPGKTILQSGDIVTELFIPAMRAHSGCGYYKLSPRKSLDLAVVGAAAMIQLNPQLTKCLEARIVLGAVAPTAVRAKKAEAILAGANLTRPVIEDAAGAASEESRPIDDVRASAWYRKRMVAVAVKRAIGIALEQARQISTDDLRLTR